ncbi:MAG: hypothetical protein H6549_12910 [Chitinophagales bacterium]|nr:hypothetical protein [Chitinophagales bacterium]
MSFPEKVDIKEEDSRLAIVTNMLKDVLDIVQPPKRKPPAFQNTTGKRNCSW